MRPDFSGHRNVGMRALEPANRFVPNFRLVRLPGDEAQRLALVARAARTADEHAEKRDARRLQKRSGDADRGAGSQRRRRSAVRRNPWGMIRSIGPWKSEARA